jgi:uncharacterized membrane protein YgcG
MKQLVFLLLLPALLLAPVSVLADEAIVDYHSDIEVSPDGSMTVAETIRVRAEGKKIKRGIYRDFPTDYRDAYGNRYQVSFELLSVERNGNPEPFHTKSLSNGVRIYIGRKDHHLAHGEYRYLIRYRTDRQLGFFEDHDELYWNVTGNDWDFPIDHASAAVHLPEQVTGGLATEAYTGPEDATGQAYHASVEDNTARFETTAPLGRHEGLTIVVSWPKGYVHEPTQAEKIRYFMEDNAALMAGVGGSLIVLLYYLVIWHRIGRDPDAGVIIPLYQPPKGYSPASMRFIKRMGYDHKAFAAALVNLAVKGYLRIEETAAGFVLHKLGKTVEPAPGEAALANRLFSGEASSLSLKRSNHRIIRKALNAHKNALRRDYEKTYFVSNSLYLLPGILVSLAVLGLSILLLPGGEKKEVGAFMMVWLTGWSAAVFFLITSAVSAWRKRAANPLLNFANNANAVVLTLFAVVFSLGELGGMAILAANGILGIGLLPLLLAGLNLLFYQLLKAPTHAGRRLLDRIEGFRRYLEVAEQDELNFHHPREGTAELFEAYLPYALALDLEQQWAQRFSDVLDGARAGSSRYRPRWYSGTHSLTGNLGALTGSLGTTLSSAVQASSRAPGSSSGGGGGGSSGGGGGGGGGGGW